MMWTWIKKKKKKKNQTTKYVPHTHSDPLQFSKYRPTGVRLIKILVGTFAHVKNRQPPSSYWTIQTLDKSTLGHPHRAIRERTVTWSRDSGHPYLLSAIEVSPLP